jgi:crotonobetainyl-CoA:carnitine CoA-transferase CaiB-like acyl-CoA transferase
MAPHGIYRAAGDDRWLAIAIDSPRAWRALAGLRGRPAWQAEAFADTAYRRDREAEIDAAIAGWTGAIDAFEAARMLQSAGVIAAPVLRPEETLADAHHRARNFYADATRVHIGEQVQIALPMRIDGRRPPFRGTAPLLGADTRGVLADVLGIDDAHYTRLVASGVVSLQPTSLRAAAG